MSRDDCHNCGHDYWAHHDEPGPDELVIENPCTQHPCTCESYLPDPNWVNPWIAKAPPAEAEGASR